jgi:ABC-type transport system substrate-binding protein
VPEIPSSLDPLGAGSRSAQLISRQLHEPLVSSQTGPYEHRGSEPGLAVTVKPSPDRTVWRLALRGGVRFQDGTAFNAAVVRINGRRWNSSPQGRRLLPGLFAVDAPRPGEVRFQFLRPRPDLPDLLASPRLGVVSPEALVPRSGEGARFRAEAAGSGTGPFRLGSRSDGALGLTRDPAWWGSPFGLGPALDAIAFRAVPEDEQRLDLLASGEVQAAEPLDAEARAEVADDPLLRRAGPIGFEASVRGLGQDSAFPVLSSVWLTTIRD